MGRSDSPKAVPTATPTASQSPPGRIVSTISSIIFLVAPGPGLVGYVSSGWHDSSLRHPRFNASIIDSTSVLVSGNDLNESDLDELLTRSAQPVPVARVRVGALALAVAGVLFVLYPAIRPYSDETSLQGATAFASNAWIVAHVLAMLGFVLMPLGLLALRGTLQDTPAEWLGFLAVVTTLIGAGLTLPYYGAEAFGLHVIGQEAIRQHSTAIVALANDVRYGPGVFLFGPGLLLLGIGGILAATAVWRSGTLPQWSGFPFALGFALYFPQFFGSPAVRVAHGLLVTSGCLWLAVVIWRARAPQSATVEDEH